MCAFIFFLFFIYLISADPIPLTDGAPKEAQIAYNVTDSYQISFASGSRFDVTFSATPLQGDVLLFVSTTQPPVVSNPSTYQLSSGLHYEGKALVFRSTNPQWPSSGIFYVAVYGASTLDAKYRVVAASNSSNIILVDGIPIQGHCETTQSEYFMITVPDNMCNLTVTVTPLSGDPDIFVSMSDPHPSANATWSSASDSLTISPATSGPYYITIYANQNSTFSLVGEIDCQGDNGQPTYLIDGIPLQGVLAIGQEKLYTFHVQDDHADISISVSRRYGDPDIYVRNDGGRPSPQSYMWASTYSGEDLLTIYPNDPHWCTNCNYTIGVFASTNTSYSILAVTSTHILTLQEGVPVREDLLQASYEYFRFDVDSSSLELTISVTPLGNGDPDLYVSTMNPPNRTSYQWMAQSRYGDSVTITHTDPRACQFCTYWISVYAFSNTTFTIVATQTGTIRIQDGVPQSGFVDREAFTYYQFQIAGPSGLSMTCTTLNGSSSLYVTSGDIYPRTDYYQWFQPSFNQIKSLSLGCPNVTCNYWIGIYGNDASSFTLLTSSTGANGSTKVLVSGIPQRDTVPQGAWDYFSVKVEVANSDLSIIVTPITGDPDLYISMTNSRPNSTSYDRKATRAGSDSIDFTNATLGTYYIGVNAWTNSTFNILALITPIDENCTDTNPYCIVQLFDGQPQEGVVHQAYYDYYALDLSSAAASLSFTLTKEYGDPDLYITNDGSMPNISNHRWSSTSVQNDSVYIQNATAGRYLVAVYAYQTSGYTLTGWTTGANNIVTLQNGIPIRGQGNAHTYQYYMLPIDSTDRDFTVTVTPFSGDPDLYVSINVTHPNATSFTWAATAYQGDSITVPMTDPRFCNCPFYIAVYCYMASTYSLIGSYTDVLNLENGVPQSGAVALHAMKYYKLRVVETHQDITIALTPRDGNPDLYVSNGTEPTVGNATWKVVDQTFSTSMLVIRTSDPNFCSSNCTYYIGVYGSLASNFTIVATISSATTTLISGVPFRDWVDTGTYEYFAFDVPTAGSDVAIILTPLTGDPDLYVSSNTSRPNTTNYQYYSRAAGADAVAIESSNATTWYIAVYAFQNSTFTVTAYILCDDCPPVWLVNGMPQNSILNQNDYQYYRFSVPNNSSELTIAVTRTLGDPDIYVRNDGLLPNKTFYNWSASAFGQDLISISNPVAGIYDIAVFAYSTTQFTITASSGGVTLLADGVAVREDLAQGQYEYFQVHVDRTDMDLTVTVTSFNGDPDLYISTLGLPNSSFSQWAAQSPREDSITIPFSSLTLGTYWISVRAWTNCTFTIIASFNNEVSLQDGIPQAGSVAYEASVYYKFVVGEGHSDLTFTLTPYTGNAYLFISINSPPNQTNYLWASKDPTTGQAITIFPDDPNWCTANSTVSCVYYAMVYGHQASNYSIVAIANGTITLQEGIPQRAYVNTAEYEYFTFVLHSATALLQFTVTPLSGDPDLYVSTTNERPNISDYQWASLAYGADTISIDYTDPHYIQGTYYVAVYAYRNSSFTIGAIVIELNGSTACDDPNICPYNLIQNGVPQVGLLPNPGDKQYYEFHVGPERVNITFTVTPRYGDPDMYIRNDDQRPNSTFNQWSARSYGSDSVTIPASDGCTNCRYLIDVEAFSHTMFSLLASTDSGIILLENGVPFSTHNDEHTYKYFYVLVTDDSEPLTISATALSGDPDLYVSQNSSRPNQTNYQWASLSYGSDTFVLAKPTPGQYYVSTYAYHNTSYIILATNGPISLINCAPQNDELDKGQTRLYQIIVRDTNMSDILITLSVESGDPIMYMNNYQNRSYPNASNYQWTTAIASATTQRYLINVSSSSSGYCSNCTYFIQVAANTTLTKYSITASYGNNCSTSLSSGTPFPSSVVQGGYVYFRGIVDRADVDLTISVTTFTGDTDVYVSVTPNPNINDPNSYQWSSVHDPNARGDVISIPHTDPHFQTGMYYIAVYGWQTSQFTITMSTSAIVLSAGASQVGVLSSDLTAYFFFRVPSPTDVIFSLNPFNATSTPSLYTLYISTDGSVTQPDEQHHTFQFSVMEGQSVTIPSTDSHTCVTPCTGYYIGVTGATAGKKFTIVASTDDTIDALFSGVNFAASVSQSRIKNFLIYVPVANLFTVELQTCAGNADLYISQDSFNPGPGNYKWSSTSTDSVDIQTIRDANATNAANMYIGVEGKDAGINEYVLTAWTSALPAQPKISQPVIHSTVGSSTVILSFTAASSPDFPPSDLEYTVYWILDSQSQNFVMYSPCGLAKGKNFGLQTSPSFKSSANDTVFFTINGLDTETEYKITVVVTDPRGSTQFYDTIIEKTTAEGGGGISISLLLGIGLPVAALVLGFIFYLLIRNRKLTKELEIEMHDVPKATLRKAVAGPPSVREGQQQDKQKPYTRLLEEEDDENYAPPEPSDPSAGLSVN